MLVRYNPWQELNTLQRQIDRVFEDLQTPNLTKAPAAEIRETEDTVYLKLELPGIEAKDLDIQVTENAVKVVAVREKSEKTEDNGKIRSEFYYGKFHRVISLPARVQNNNVKAEYKDGILNLSLPKTEQEKNKVVKVNLEQPAA